MPRNVDRNPKHSGAVCKSKIKFHAHRGLELYPWALHRMVVQHKATKALGSPSEYHLQITRSNGQVGSTMIRWKTHFSWAALQILTVHTHKGCGQICTLTSHCMFNIRSTHCLRICALHIDGSGCPKNASVLLRAPSSAVSFYLACKKSAMSYPHAPHIPSYSIIFHHIPSYSIIFHHIPSYSIIFHHIPSYSIIFHHIPSYSIIFHHIPSYSIIFHHIPTPSSVFLHL